MCELAVSFAGKALPPHLFAQFLFYVTQAPAQMSFVLEDCSEPLNKNNAFHQALSLILPHFLYSIHQAREYI